MSLLNFNASEVAPSAAFTPVPAGRYAAVITDSEMKPTKSGGGQYLRLEFEIIEGPCAGRKLWSRLNLENANSEAVRIARSDLSAICHAVKVLMPGDSVELHNIPLAIVVRCKKDQDDETVSEIKGYEAHTPARLAEPAPPARHAAMQEEIARRVQQQSAWMRSRA